MSGIQQGRVVVVTGAGQGIGRHHALEFARQGAQVVVNDVAAGDGPGSAQSVVDEIVAAGGTATANRDDIASWDGAARLIATAVDGYGRLDALVNNAGFVRDRMLVKVSESEWDDVVRVHLKGHAATLHHAAAYWRERAGAGEVVDAAVVNTTSGAGLFGSVGQANYVAAKAGILGLTLNAAAELGRYGVRVNAIAPAARTQMTEGTFADDMAAPESGFDAMAPENVAPLVVWLASPDADGVTGRCFEVEGGKITALQGWTRNGTVDNGARWDPAAVGGPVRELLAALPEPVPVYGA